jgi:dynein intermediate chain 4, axonemal
VRDKKNGEEKEDISNERLIEIEKSKEKLRSEEEQIKIQKPKKIAKVYLKESETFDLGEIPSLIVLKGTEEGNAMEKFNANYAFITSGAGRRRTSEAEIQTEYCPLKTRSINTEIVKKVEQESFATNYGIYDAFQELEEKTKLLEVEDEDRKIEVPRHTGEVENSLDLLGMNENFLVASMILERALAENIFRTQQMRKFNIPSPNPLDIKSKVSYRMETLWIYKSVETMGKDVVDLSWCPSNDDLLAVAYGAYNYRKAENRISGSVLVWSGKNPVNPERRYCYQIPVSAVEFSRQIPQYLAVAFYDGSIEVIDITPAVGKIVIAKSERKSSPVFDPIWSIQWIQVKGEDLILTASQDGRVMKFKIGSGPDLIGFPQVYLERVEGTVEALPIEHKKTLIEGDHHPQAWCLTSSPASPDVYLVGTDEGCVHICSTNFPHQHFGVLQLHNGGISSIEFSPFSPKIFLTAGSDWTVRIWIEGILEPIVELSDGFGAVHNAYWSPTNPTVIATCTREAVRVWDLLRKNPKPAIVKSFGKELTVFKFSNCGRSFVVGDKDGNTHVVAFEDFPFPPHYQFDQLKKLLDSLLTERPELKQQVKDLGFLGYESGKKFGKI